MNLADTCPRSTPSTQYDAGGTRCRRLLGTIAVLLLVEVISGCAAGVVTEDRSTLRRIERVILPSVAMEDVNRTLFLNAGGLVRQTATAELQDSGLFREVGSVSTAFPERPGLEEPLRDDLEKTSLACSSRMRGNLDKSTSALIFIRVEPVQLSTAQDVYSDAIVPKMEVRMLAVAAPDSSEKVSCPVLVSTMGSSRSRSQLGKARSPTQVLRRATREASDRLLKRWREAMEE